MSDYQLTFLYGSIIAVILSYVTLSLIFASEPVRIDLRQSNFNLNKASLVDQDKAVAVLNGTEITNGDLGYLATIEGMIIGASYLGSLAFVKKTRRR